MLVLPHSIYPYALYHCHNMMFSTMFFAQKHPFQSPATALLEIRAKYSGRSIYSMRGTVLFTCYRIRRKDHPVLNFLSDLSRWVVQILFLSFVSLSIKRDVVPLLSFFQSYPFSFFCFFPLLLSSLFTTFVLVSRLIHIQKCNLTYYLL